MDIFRTEMTENNNKTPYIAFGFDRCEAAFKK